MHYVIIHPEIITFLNLPTEVLLNAAAKTEFRFGGQRERERILNGFPAQRGVEPNIGLNPTTLRS